MKVPKELVEQWWGDWMGSLVGLTQAEYIAERACDYALEAAAKVCEQTEIATYIYGTQSHDSGAETLSNAIDAIRSLKEVQS